MVIGVLTTSYPRHAGDYAGSFVEDRVRVLLREGHRVEVFAAGDSARTTCHTDGALTVTRIGAPDENDAGLFYGQGGPETLEHGDPRMWWQAARFWADLAATVRQRVTHLDALETHWLVPCAAVALAVAPDKPLRAYAHSGDVALLERLPAGNAMARVLSAKSANTDFVFVTGDLRARFAALAGRPIGRVARLAAPAELFPRVTPALRQTARAALGLTGPTVIAVGRLVPIKGFDHLIAACAEAATVNDQLGAALTAIIIGDGPERAALQSAARAAGVRLRLPGWVPRPKLADWLHAADLYAQPSMTLASGRCEGLPVATLEAMAVGLPVVASDQPGLREMRADHPGLRLVNPRDRRAFGAAIAHDLSRFCVGNVTGV